MRALKRIALFIMIVICVSQADTRHIGSSQAYTTINAALSAANEGDTLLIHWEPEPYSVYTEHVVIDKELTLTSDWTPGSNPAERPLIRYNLSTSNEVISIQSDYVTVSNLRIENASPFQAATGDDLMMSEDAGISVINNNCTLSHCAITRCRVGILLYKVINVSVDSCTIGRQYDPKWFTPVGTSAHDGNFFGIVQVEPERSVSSTSVGDYKPVRIFNCTIARNRFYGIVLRGGSMTTVENNLIVWNGTDSEFTSTNHYGDGGILCLFTHGEMLATEVTLQSPLITSNTIYGNDGFQVCVITDDPGREPREIANAPVFMSNLIGPDTMAYPSGTPTSVPNWLVSCTSESNAAASTPQHGSAPVMAFNNLFRPEATGSDRMFFAHPANPTPTPDLSTHTPTPTISPTPAGTLSLNTRTPAPLFTAIPTRTSTPTPFPGSPTITPTFKPYRMDAETWSIRNTFGDPKIVGGNTVEAFDFHLQDPVFQMTPTPMATRSVCYDHGGFQLNPGITQTNQSPDIDQSDVGMHFAPNVPPVSQIQCIPPGVGQMRITWQNPEYYPDSSLLDIAGVIFYFGYDDQSEITINHQIYLDPCEEYVITSIPALNTNVAGVALFNTVGTLSSIVWVELCD